MLGRSAESVSRVSPSEAVSSAGAISQEGIDMKRLVCVGGLRAWVFLSFFLIAGTAWAGPCTTASATCTEWITLAGGPARSLVYRTYSLDARNDTITRAVIMVHGQGRDADSYFRHILAAAFLAGALEDTVVISPCFASNNGECRDALAPDEVSWRCLGPNSWRSGGTAVGDDRITSFDLADEILRKLARKEVFPNLRAIVVAGHSAGGRCVGRYVTANQIHDRLG